MAETDQIKDQEPRTETPRIIASILIALSGLLLYLDKVFIFIGFEGHSTYGFSNYSNFVWNLTQSIAPLLMIIAFRFRPYYLSFLIPIYCYAIQIAWIYQPDLYMDDIQIHLYAIGTCSFFILLLLLINKISLWRKQQEMLKNEFQQETKEILNILKSKTLSES